MRIDRIQISNFRGIRDLELDNLGSTVIVAGANGSGKSCIFDAIRLLKSAYGGYQQNEWHHWMSEFQINFANNAESFATFFQDKRRPLSIRIEFRLHPAERQYLQQHGEELVRTSVWRLIAPEMYGWSSYNAAPMAAQYRSREPEVAEQTRIQWAEMQRELAQDTITAHLSGVSGAELSFTNSKALEILFSSFAPGHLGVIDYHGAQRMYTREQVSGVNLDLTAQEQQNRQHALYNYNAKYSNVKSEMASSYIKELLSEKAGVSIDAQNPISATLQELFKTFFPDKEFLGLTPTIDGALAFPVRTASGSIHDLNELSAGEKEVLFGYLRIRNSAPRYSLILIDEPELHLNPRLIKGLPHFYHQHLGVALDNQIWLITHSDALLREAVGRPEYSVYHMSAVTNDPNDKQLQRLNLEDDLAQKALISLVGDIAAYRPGKKVVIFEGGGDSDFDVYMVGELFPELPATTNVVSSGNKLRVRELHDVLETLGRNHAVNFTTFSVTDRDTEVVEVSAPRFQWDRYHIENYLLEPAFVLKVMRDLALAGMDDDNAIYDKLRDCAAATLPTLVRHQLAVIANEAIVSSIDLGVDPKRRDIGVAVSEAIGRSLDRIKALQSQRFAIAELVKNELEVGQKLQESLGTDAWRATFRGRDVLKEFCSRYVKGKASYATFRDLIIARMKDAAHKPAGMQGVIGKILE